METKKLSSKERLVKKLERRFINLKKKLTAITQDYQDQKRVVVEEIEIIGVQLKALKK